MKNIRRIIFGLLCLITLWLIMRAASAPPDPGYERIFNFLTCGLLVLVLWIPYNVTCMFLDGNKVLGLLAIFLVALALGFVAVGAFTQNFGTQTMALVGSILAVPTLWILSFINFIRRKKYAEPEH